MKTLSGCGPAAQAGRASAREVRVQSGIAGMFAAMAAVLVAQPGHAQGAYETEMSVLFDQHVALCGPAMSDPQAFRQALPQLLPTDTFGFSTTDDGHITRITISTLNSQVATQYSRYDSPSRSYENCATYYSNVAWFEVDVMPIALAFEMVAVRLLGRDNVVGGEIPLLHSSYDQTGSDVLVQSGNNFEFLMEGILPGEGLHSITGLGQGYVSIVSQRDLSQLGQ